MRGGARGTFLNLNFEKKHVQPIWSFPFCPAIANHIYKYINMIEEFNYIDRCITISSKNLKWIIIECLSFLSMVQDFFSIY